MWMADATTGPAGQRLTVGERVLEVVDRYGHAHVVSQCMVTIALPLVLATQRTEQRLDGRSASADVSLRDVAPLVPGVMDLLVDWDPEGLMGFTDVPHDEYDLEATTFSALMRAGYRMDASTVVAVWEGWFGPSSVMTQSKDAEWIRALASRLNSVPLPAGSPDRADHS